MQWRLSQQHIICILSINVELITGKNIVCEPTQYIYIIYKMILYDVYVGSKDGSFSQWS